MRRRARSASAEIVRRCRASLTFARFQRSTAARELVSMLLIWEMMLCASACLDATGPGSAVAAEAMPKAHCYCTEKCGYVTDSRPDNGLPARGQRLRASSPRKRHKVGRLTGFPDVRKVFRSQKVVKPQLSRLSQSLTQPRRAVCYVWRLVWRPARFAAPLLLVTIGCAICGAVGAASGANPSKSDIRSVAALRACERHAHAAHPHCDARSLLARRATRARARAACGVARGA